MANRLSKIYTRTGDDGTTGMADGSRVDKDSLRVQAIGDIDELNCVLGMVVGKCGEGRVKEMLIVLQHDLFNLGGQLSVSGGERIDEQRVVWLEQNLDDLNAGLPPLKEFILPGGGDAATCCHLARAVCRRAERSLVALSREAPFDNRVNAYVNRLSDLLFVVCRVLGRQAGEDEVYWQSSRILNDTKSPPRC